MFDTLLASPANGAPSSRAVTAALVLHVLLIAGAVSTTASPRGGTRPVARDTIQLELTQLAKPAEPNSTDSPTSGPEAAIPEPPRVPEIALDAPEIQPLRLSFSPLAASDSSRTSQSRSSGESDASPHSLRPVFSPVEVDELPELVEEVHLRYPRQQQRAGVSGLVQVQYVVGSDGRVNKRTIRVLVVSHPAFLVAALQALRDSRFKPARRGGRPTAVLVQQTFRFKAR